MGLYWSETEDSVFTCAQKDLLEFAPLHRDEIFYGFYLHCNAPYREIFMYMNTEDLLLKKIEQEKVTHAELYAGWSQEKLIESYRWSAADWGYVISDCIERDRYEEMLKKSSEVWDSLPPHDDGDPKEYEQFNELICRVAIRLERAGVFDAFQKTSDFGIVCADYGDDKNGRLRLERVRASMPPA